MESSSENLHPYLHKVQEQQYVKYYSSLVTQTGHQALLSTTDEWNPNQFPNNIIGGKYNRNNLTESNIIPKSRDVWAAVPQPLISRSSMNQDSCEFLLANMKDEMSDLFPKLSEMIMYSHSSSTTADHDHHNSNNNLPISKKYNPQSSSDDHHHDLVGNLWHTKFSVSNNITDLQLSSARDLYTNGHDVDHSPCLESSTAAASRHDVNHIFPSTNISTSDLCFTLFPSSLDLNLTSLDLSTSSTYDHGGVSCNQYNLLDHHSPDAKLNTVYIPMGQDHIRSEQSDSTQSTSSKVSAFVSGSITRSKRPAAGSFSESTKESHTDAKKQRSMSRSPCPTLKVRKEKLGDRVAALQKLVAPFGKTDTSTVLTEAIGYIQFLHDQVQTFSVPFMKSSPSKLYRTVQVGSKGEDGKEEQKPDLRSKGLCLVPQSYASYFVNSCSSGI